MKLQIVPARQGALWVRYGFQSFLRRPLGYFGLFVMVTFAALIVGIVPVAGSLVAFGAMPLVSLGFMLATQQVLSGGTPTPLVFVTPLRGEPSRRMNLLKLGAIYAVGAMLMVLVWSWVDGGRIASYQAALNQSPPSPEKVAAMANDGGLLISLFSPMLLMSLLSIPFWHAPALIHWGGLPPTKALFFSTVACWRNRGAFLAYAATWFALFLFIGMLISLVFALLGLAQGPATVVIVPLAILLSCLFYASLYFTFADCFELPATPGAPAP